MDLRLINKPLIIFGTGRSGTTLIAEMVFRHPLLAFPSNYHEKFPQIPQVGLMKRIFINPYWQYHGKKYQANVNTVSSLNPYTFIPSEAWKMWRYLLYPKYDFSREVLLNREIDEESKAFAQRYFSKLVRYQSANKLAFKITGPSRIRFLSSLFPDAYFLHITRKPVPTIASFLKVPFWKTRGINQLWWHFDLSLEEQAAVLEHNNDPVWMTAFQISKIIETTQYELEKVRPNYLRISYEDFIKDPKESISEVFSFIGISNHNRCFDYLKDNPILERSVSDDKYFDKDNLKKIYSFFPECK